MSTNWLLWCVVIYGVLFVWGLYSGGVSSTQSPDNQTSWPQQSGLDEAVLRNISATPLSHPREDHDQLAELVDINNDQDQNNDPWSTTDDGHQGS